VSKDEQAGWVEPADPTTPAEYELTRRSADAAPGYDLELPDLRVKYRWNGRGAWISGYYAGAGEQLRAKLVCLHSNNGWRFLSRTPARDTGEGT
jgi:hypothetical protein